MHVKQYIYILDCCSLQTSQSVNLDINSSYALKDKAKKNHEKDKGEGSTFSTSEAKQTIETVIIVFFFKGGFRPIVLRPPKEEQDLVTVAI